MSVTQSCSGSGSKKLSKIFGTNLYDSDKTDAACNFSTECDTGSECPYMGDSGGCYCLQGFCVELGVGGEGEFKVPEENRCSDYNDCECR